MGAMACGFKHLPFLIGVMIVRCEELDVKSKAAELMKEFDKNKDGKISYDELAEAHLGDEEIADNHYAEDGQQGWPAIMMGGLPAVDNDGDDKINVDELEQLIKMFHHQPDSHGSSS